MTSVYSIVREQKENFKDDSVENEDDGGSGTESTDCNPTRYKWLLHIMKLQYLKIFLLSSEIPVLCIMTCWKTIIRRVKIDGREGVSGWLHLQHHCS